MTLQDFMPQDYMDSQARHIHRSVGKDPLLDRRLFHLTPFPPLRGEMRLRPERRGGEGEELEEAGGLRPPPPRKKPPLPLQDTPRLQRETWQGEGSGVGDQKAPKT